MLAQRQVLAHRELNVLADSERGEERALLEQDSPSPLQSGTLLVVGRGKIAALDRD
jgi:hypothetical protein